MQALQIDYHGPVSALTVRDVPRPALSPHEVLIEIHAAALNPSDVASAEGRFDHAPLPRIAARYPLSQAAEAYQRVASGKIVLIPDRWYNK